MADMTTLIVISSFIMFPAVMMAQEVVNHGGNDQWHQEQDFIAHLFVGIMFKHPVAVAVSYTESCQKIILK